MDHRLATEEELALLYREARLLDCGRFEEWLTLFTTDACYWVPCNRDDCDIERDVSLIYDDRTRLEDRVWRLVHSGAAFAQQPPSRTRRLISNVEVIDQPDASLTVYSNFLLTEVRRGKQNLIAGQNEHTLRREGGELMIARKRVCLVNNDLPIQNLAFLV